MPTLTVSLQSLGFVCVLITACHCCSAWLPPSDTPSILQAKKKKNLSEDLIFRFVSHTIRTQMSLFNRHTDPRFAVFGLIWGDVMSDVGPSAVISCLYVVAWHGHGLVHPTPELVSKSRFNLHASCLQEEEVEEFRVSLSCCLVWFGFAPDQQRLKFALHPPPPTMSSACSLPPCPSFD